MREVVDGLGLVKENRFLTVYIRATNRAFPFRVVTRWNRGYEVINYGPLPLDEGDTLPTYDGGTTSVPADGVMPARAYLRTGTSFPLEGVVEEDDMWYVHEAYRDRVFHVIQYVTPSFLRIDVQIPAGVDHARFQKDKKIVGIGYDFGFARGRLEMVHLPRVRCGYRWGNDTNLDVYTLVKFVYGEYVVEIPDDASLIFDILVGRVPSHWVSLPITAYEASRLKEELLKVYGIEGFTVYREGQKGKALAEYMSLLREVKR